MIEQDFNERQREREYRLFKETKLQRDRCIICATMGIAVFIAIAALAIAGYKALVRNDYPVPAGYEIPADTAQPEEMKWL